MVTTRKDKNLVYFEEEGHSAVWYDINTGKYSSNRTKSYKHLPVLVRNSCWYQQRSFRPTRIDLNSYMLLHIAQNPLAISYDGYGEELIGLIQLVDKLNNALGDTKLEIYYNNTPMYSNISFFLKDPTAFKYLIQFIKKPDRPDDAGLSSLLARCREAYQVQNLRLCPDDYYGAKWLNEQGMLSDMVDLCNNYSEVIDWSTLSYYYTHGLFDRWAYAIKHPTIRVSIDMRNDLCNVLVTLKRMNMTAPKDKWTNVELNTYKMYDKYLDQQDAALLNLPDKLKFEDNDYIVVLPQRVSDYREEAEVQHNCVYTNYALSVLRKETQVVFVREKAHPEIPYVTCEVCNDGTIMQFLLRYNQRPNRDSAVMQFYTKYQAYLKEVYR